MKIMFTAIFTLLISVPAHAEIFFCQGSGRFSGIDGTKPIELNHPGNTYRVILDANSETVALRLDDINSDGTHYLELEVKSPDGHTRSVKASRRDMVMYTDSHNGKVDIANCIPMGGT